MKILLIDDQRYPEYIDDPRKPDSKFTSEEVEIARTGAKGIKLLRKNQYDILLLDHDLGLGMNGKNVLKYLIEKDLLPDIIYLVTANIIAGPEMMWMLIDLFEQGKIKDYGWIK